jgi:hypothetical protein
LPTTHRCELTNPTGHHHLLPLLLHVVPAQLPVQLVLLRRVPSCK